MAVTKAKKEVQLKELVEKLKKSKVTVFSGYSGINVKLMTGLRKKLHAEDVDYVVIKKTLLQIGAKEAGLPEIDEKLLEGPIAVAIGYGDALSPIKVLYGVSKDKAFEDKLKLFGGIMEGKVLSKEDVKTLATIPSREELLSKLVYLLMSPVSGFHHVLHETVRKFVGTVDAYAKSKPAAPVAVAAEPVAVVAEAAPEAPAAPAETPVEPTPAA